MSMVLIRPAELENPSHQEAILELLDRYAREPVIGGNGISQSVRDKLIPGLREQTTGRHFLAFRDNVAIGLAICFLGFSTFRAKPLLNVHDLAVHPEYRGQGVGRQLLAAVEECARNHGCCKLTLEVNRDNIRAKRLYERVGFESGDPAGNGVAFLSKPLSG